MKSNYDIEAGLTILQESTMKKYFNDAKSLLINCRNLIRRNEHKQFLIAEKQKK